MIKKIIKIFSSVMVALLVIVLIALAGAHFYMKTDHGKTLVRSIVNDAIPGHIAWEKIDVSVLGGSIGIHELVISDPAQNTIIDAGRVFLDIGMIELLRGTIDIVAELETSRAMISRDANGDINIIRAFMDPSAEKERVSIIEDPIQREFPFNVILRSVTVSDGFFEYTDHVGRSGKQPETITFADINMAIRNANMAKRSGRAAFSVGKGLVDMGRLYIPVSHFRFESAIDGGQMEALRADLQLAGENEAGPHLLIEGSASDVFDDPTVDMELSAAAELSEIRKMLSLDIPLSGRTTLALSATGSPENPNLRIDAHYGGGDIPGVTLEEITLKSTMADLSVDITSLTGRMHGAEVDLTGTVDLSDAFAGGLLAAPDLTAISYKARVDGENVDFEKLPWTRNVMSGTARGRIDVEGTGIFPKTLSAAVDADINGRQIAVGDILAPIDPDINLKGGLKDGIAVFDSVAISLQDTDLHAAGDYTLFENTLNASLTLDTPDMAQFLEPLRVAVTSGATTLSAEIAGPVMQPDVSAVIDSKNLAYGEDLRIGDTHLQAVLDPSGRVSIEQLLVDNRGSQIEIKGDMTLFEDGFAGFQSDLPADLTAELRQVVIPNFYPQLDLAGKINGHVHLSEKIMAPAATVSLRGDGLSFDETRIGNVAADMTLKDETLSIGDITLENRRSSLYLAGAVDLFAPGTLSLLPDPELTIVFRESTLYIDDFVDAAAGRITVSGQAAGTLTDIAAGLSVTGADLEAAGHPIGELTAHLGLESGRLTFEPLKIVNARSELSLTGGITLLETGSIALHEDPAIDIDIAGEAIYIDDFIEALHGELSIAGKVNGSLRDPRGNITINGQNIDMDVQRLESFRIESRFADKTVFLDTANVTIAPGETIRANGRVSLDNRFALEIDSDEITLDQIGILENTGIAGTMRIAAAGDGTIDDPVLTGEIFLNDLGANGKRINPVNIDFELKDRTANVHASGDFTMDAAYRTDTGNFNFNADFDAMAIDPFLHMAELENLSGTLTAGINANGNISELPGIAAALDIETFRILHRWNNSEPVELVRVANLTANVDGGRFSIPRNEILLMKTNPFIVSGSGRIDEAYELTVEGIIPAAVAAAFTHELGEPEGEIDFRGTLSRTRGQAGKQPDIDAEIELRDLGFTIQSLMQTIHQLNGRIRITGDAVAVEDITGQLDTGRFTASGGVDLEEGFTPGKARLVVNAHALPIHIPGMLEVTVNSEMRFSGTPDDTLLSGEIILLEGLYYKDVEFSLIGEATRRRRRTPDTAEAPDIDIPYLKNLALDIETSYRKPLMVDNNLALMTLRPELSITGTINDPGVTGRAEVSRGTISYRNIEFEISRGVIDFLDPYRIQPDIDILAISDVRHWEIRLEVSGTTDDIKFKLSSNPPEEHADILSLLVFGKTSRELAEGTGPAGASPEQMLVNLLAGRLEEDLQAGTGLDIIEVEYTQENGTASEDGVRLKVGKELSRRLTLTYGVERTGGETVQQQTATYRLLEYLSMNAFQDTGGTFGGEMQFRLEFR